MLSERATTILGLIAEGRSYDQILQRHPELTYLDIFAAAREALAAAQADVEPTPEGVVPSKALERSDAEPAPTKSKRLPSYIERARATHRRAWARWTHEEDAQLTGLFRRGDSRAAMVQALGRQPGAIRSRLLKLGLISEADAENAVSDSSEPDREPLIADHEPEQVAWDNRLDHDHASPLVPGWESFRQRLSKEPPTP